MQWRYAPTAQCPLHQCGCWENRQMPLPRRPPGCELQPRESHPGVVVTSELHGLLQRLADGWDNPQNRALRFSFVTDSLLFFEYRTNAGFPRCYCNARAWI